MDEKILITRKTEETTSFGRRILQAALQANKKEKPLIFYLKGELGAGKTHFVKGLAVELGITSITSPTFVMMKKFKISAMVNECENKGKQFFFHIDCYRIYDAQDALQIDLDKVLLNPHAIIAIEWAERIEELIPKPYWKIEFTYKSEEERSIHIKYVS